MKILKLKVVAAPLLAMSLAFVPGKEVYLGGENIGFGLKAEGVIVSGTYELKTDKGYYEPSRDSDIQKGDVITKIDDVAIDSLSDINNAVYKMDDGTLELSITRNEKELKRNLSVFTIDGKYKTGLYVKERVLGIGTLTYYDPSDGTYGALGHPVLEKYGKTEVELSNGELYESEVIGIKKSTDGSVGAKVATLNETKKLGDVIKNSEYGIYGHLYEPPKDQKVYKLASASEVKTGKATIYTVLNGNKKEAYSIEITSLKNPNYIDTKGISFKITDKKLLSLTNGVVSGMSGSPIVQDDKLVGAVTHIIIKDCDTGYGVYVEHMFNMLAG